MYKYDIHIHTSNSSACASASGFEQAVQYKEAGYDGIFITDHFFRGNTSVPSYLPWVERVELFCQGYDEAKKCGDKIGLTVFFGYEENYDGTEFLIYGLDKEWLLQHPEMEKWTIEEQFEQVDKAGGVVIQAHPFRDRPYIPKVRLYPQHCHGVEAMNLGNHESENKKAFYYAKDYNLVMTGGSDGHHNKVLGGGIMTKNKFNTVQDFVNAVKHGEQFVLLP